MPHDIKSFRRIQETITKLEVVAQTIQALAEDGGPGLEDARDDLERIRREIEALGERVITKALGGE